MQGRHLTFSSDFSCIEVPYPPSIFNLHLTTVFENKTKQSFFETLHKLLASNYDWVRLLQDGKRYEVVDFAEYTLYLLPRPCGGHRQRNRVLSHMLKVASAVFCGSSLRVLPL
ncbi:hypothetical protein ABFA07_023595 [Porites harrisoni]